MNFYYLIIAGMTASFLLCFFMLIFYFKYRKNIAEQRYKLKVTELNYQKELLHASINSQEKERKKIGMNLHDEIGAGLAGIKLNLDHFLESFPSETDYFKKGTSIILMIDQMVVRTRNISHELSPYIKGKYGFYDAIAHFCDLIEQSGKIRIDIYFKEDRIKTLLKGIKALLVYRILVELINNSLKHANATLIDITFNLSQTDLIIKYLDDGIGFDKNDLRNKKGIGFHNIESRLSYLEGDYSIFNANDQTHIEIIVPLQSDENEHY